MRALTKTFQSQIALRNTLTKLSPKRLTSTVRAFEEIPGPKGVDEFFGAGGFGRLDKVLPLFREKYGDIVVQDFFGRKFVYLFHPDYVQTAYQNEGKYPRGIIEVVWAPVEFSKKYFGENAMSDKMQSGEGWRTWRSKVQKDLFSPKDAAAYLPLMEKSIDEATDVFPEWAKNPTNHKLFYSVASFDLLQYIAFNQGMDFWKGDFDKNPFKHVVIAALDAFSNITTLASYTKETAPKELFDSFCENMKITHDFLAERVNTILSSKDFNPEGTAFAAYFQKLIERGELEKKYYVEHGSGLLFAALDTTASNIMWFVYNLARTPRVQEKLYEEIKSVCGDGPLKMEHLTKIPYMKACLKENFRVTPVVSNITRITPEDTVIGGYNVPANTIISMAQYFTYCHDEKIYKDSKEFKPERWNRDKKEERSDTLHDHPYMVLPFSSGPRMCLGARVAELETMAFIAKLIQKYKISVAPNSPEPEYITFSTTQPNPVPTYVIEKRA